MDKLGRPIDNSQIQTFKDCALKYRFQYRDGYAAQDSGDAEHDREFGSAVHSGLAEWYRGKGEDAMIEAFRSEYGVHLDEEDLAKTPETGVILLREYIKEVEGRDSAFEIVSVEETEELTIGEIRYLVKIDLVLRRKSTGEIYGMDHKVTGKSLKSSDFWNRFEPNDQITGYDYHLAKKYGGCSGIYVNGLQAGYRSRAYKGEPAGFHYHFERQLFNRSPIQREVWEKRLIQWTEKLQESKERNVWLPNTSQCRFCSYRPICIAEWNPDLEEDRELIEIQYKKVDPFAYLEKKKGEI